MYLLNWDEALPAGSAGAGGKGWNLARLHRYGFAVPSGGVVHADGYRHVMAAPHLQALARAAAGAGDPASVAAADALDALRAELEAVPLPAALAADLERFLTEHDLTDRPVAVRSSATAEDSAAASFAGIHQSVLNVSGPAAVTAALRRCYASLWTPQAVAYRRRIGLADDEVAAAVVIQAMVPARTAGVAFSCDPKTGRTDRAAVSAAFGLGEAVVSGAIQPDEYEVDTSQFPPSIIRRQISVANNRSGAALSDAQIIALTLLVGRVYDALGALTHPQDVEWAHDGQQFWLLQARPVTGLPAPTFAPIADQPVIWSNANLKDVMPGVVSTLGWSSLRSGLEALLSAPLRMSGYALPGGTAWARLYEGRAYFNLSVLHWVFYDALGMTPAQFNRVIGGHQPETRVPPPNLADRARRYAARLRLIAASLVAMNRAPADFRRLWAWTDEAEQADLTAATHQELLTRTLRVKTIMEEFLPRFNLINGAAGETQQILFRLLEPQFGARAVGLVNAMLAGAAGVTSAEQGERLVRLGNQALDEAAAAAFFTDPDWQPLQWQPRLEGTQFKREFERYLRDFGHRGIYELEVSNPRWREDPTYLLDTVRSQVLTGRKLTVADQRHKRTAALREVYGRLGWRPVGLQVRYFTGVALRSARLREMGKSVLVKVVGLSRLLALEMGRRLAAEDALDRREDVFELSWLDLAAYLLAKDGTDGFKALVADREALRQHHLSLDPPDVIIGDEPVRPAALPEAAGPVLVGMGVAAGRAGGRACLLRHPQEGTRLQPGDVLVAPSTDPAWTPLFLRAAAVVMQTGGYLSHGAIVAREYGIPAVVNIPDLLRTVTDGEELVVDGNEGKVYRTGTP